MKSILRGIQTHDLRIKRQNNASKNKQRLAIHILSTVLSYYVYL